MKLPLKTKHALTEYKTKFNRKESIEDIAVMMIHTVLKIQTEKKESEINETNKQLLDNLLTLNQETSELKKAFAEANLQLETLRKLISVNTGLLLE